MEWTNFIRESTRMDANSFVKIRPEGTSNDFVEPIFR